MIVGSPETVRQRLEDYASRVGFGLLIANFSVGNAPRDYTEKSMRLFAEKVMPKLRNVFPDWADDNRFWTTPLSRRVTAGALPKQAPTSADLAKAYAVEA